MMASNFSKIIFYLLLITILFACTENPFFDDKIKSRDTIIRGKVVLSDHSTPDEVYVWMEGFDFGTWTDDGGNFEIVLPPPDRQAGAGVTGTYKIYYYLANFKLDSSLIVIKNGEVQRLHGDLDENAELKQSKYLVKVLNIKTEIDPAIVTSDYSGPIDMTLSLDPLIDSVFVKFPNKSQGPLAIVFLQKISPEEDYFEILDVNGFALTADIISDSLTNVPKIWRAGFHLNANRLPKGKYKIIPYFLIEQGPVPFNLLNDFGQNITIPARDFINVPIKREGGELEVREISK